MSSNFENNCHDISNTYKYLHQINPDGKFWSVEKVLTYNKPFMVITSSRSIGKTTNLGCFLILDYLLNGYTFIYLRRTKDEMLMTCRDYFNNSVSLINNYTKFKIETLYYDGGDYYLKLEGEEEIRHIGYSMGLSLESKYKSKPFDHVGTILYDEFLPKDKTKYLGSLDTDPDREPRLLNSLYGSVDREIGKAFKSSTRVILSGNTESIYNPFFVSWGIVPYLYKDEKAKIINPKDKPWILQRVRQVEATKDFEKTLLFAMSNEADRGYNFNNDGGDDFNPEWIQKPERGSQHVIFVRLEKNTYQVLRNKSEFYIVKFTGKPYDRVKSLDFTSFSKDDFMLIKQWRSDISLMLVYDSFCRGSLRFDSVQTKRVFTSYLQLV